MEILRLFAELAKEIAVFAVIAFVFARTPLARRVLVGRLAWRERAAITVVATAMAVAGTYWGIWVNGALANTRVVGAMVAGLLGGPAAGLIAGLAAGTHRYFVGGFTALACGLSTTVEGLLAGWVRHRLQQRAISGLVGFATTFVAEILQMVIILAVARPLPQAWALVKVIAIPMVVGNAAGVGLLMAIIRDAQLQEERAGAAQAHMALAVARRTLPHFRSGFTPETARAAAEIILDETGVAAVAITDDRNILSYAGAGAEHQEPGQPISATAVQQALATGLPAATANARDAGCTPAHCPIGPGVVMPLRDGARVIGTLHLYQRGAGPLSPLTEELARGTAQLLSTQAEVARLQSLAQLAVQAELRALQAQINPHFLFNALNTISALSRKDPARSREVIASLSHYLRSSLRTPGAEVTLAEELEYCEAYLTIEQERFGERLSFRFDVEPGMLECRVPVLSLQPLVENSVRHGLMPKTEPGQVVVKGRREAGWVVLIVADDGVGMAADGGPAGAAPAAGALHQGHGIGLMNVRERLKFLYGSDDLLTVESRPGLGTTVTLRMPMSDVAPAGQQRPSAARGGG